MNPKEIDKLEAGPELDALIAEKVMGLTQCFHAFDETPLWYDNDRHFDLPEYSTDIAAAWKVVEKLSHSGVDFYLERDPYGRTHWARFNDTNQGTYNKGGGEDKRLGDADAPTAPLAICRAALKAIGDTNDTPRTIL